MPIIDATKIKTRRSVGLYWHDTVNHFHKNHLLGSDT